MAYSDLKKAGEAYGFAFDKSGVIFGNYRGYNICVEEHTNERLYNVFAWVQPSESSPPLQDINEALSAFVQTTGQKFVKFFHVQGARITIQLKMARNNDQNIMRTVDALATYLSSNYYHNVCADCGTESGLSFYRINGVSAGLCEPCYQKAIAGLAGNEQAAKAKKGNLITGIVGALLGALLGAVLWVVVSQLGYIAGIVGLVISVCAIKGFELFGGKLNVAGIIIIMVVVVGTIYFSNYFSYALMLHQEIVKSYGDVVTFSNSFQLLPELLKEPEISSSFYRDLIVGYLLTAVASFSTIIAFYRKSNNKFSAKRLGE